MKKRIVLLGASGSIGIQTLDVIDQHPEDFELVAFSVGHNIDVARDILKAKNISLICVQEEKDAQLLKNEFPQVNILFGDEGLITLAELEEYDVLVNALVGFVGFAPTLAGIQSHHDIALANKETLVVGGQLIREAVEKYKVSLYPIDSEHSAIFQCLQGNSKKQVEKLIVTASGGSFRSKTRAELQNVTLEDALKHPNWQMGAKITIDSATMMNKGFEVIEAHWLFNMPYEKIDVLMHEESVIHSMVEYQDHSVIAQLGNPDMRVPIQYSLSYPNRYVLHQDQPFNLAKIGTLHFKEPDFVRYPLLKLAYDVGKKGGNLAAVMNAANEVANLAFRKKKISFLQIEDVVIKTVNAAEFHPITSVEDLISANQFGVNYAEKLVKEIRA